MDQGRDTQTTGQRSHNHPAAVTSAQQQPHRLRARCPQGSLHHLHCSSTGGLHRCKGCVDHSSIPEVTGLASRQGGISAQHTTWGHITCSPHKPPTGNARADYSSLSYLPSTVYLSTRGTGAEILLLLFYRGGTEKLAVLDTGTSRQLPVGSQDGNHGPSKHHYAAISYFLLFV